MRLYDLWLNQDLIALLRPAQCRGRVLSELGHPEPETRTLAFVLISFIRVMAVLACFDPWWPNLKLGVAWFDSTFAMSKTTMFP